MRAASEPVVLDAAGQTLGRVSSQAAARLMGKNKPTFSKNKKETFIVEIINASKVRVSGSKTLMKTYKRYSGYHSGLHEARFDRLFTKNPALVLKKAVFGMLPKNKFRRRLIKNLIIKN